jgi:hypothetical protein
MMNLNTLHLKQHNQLQTLVRLTTVLYHFYFDLLKQLLGETTKLYYEPEDTSLETTQSTADFSETYDSPLSFLL